MSAGADLPSVALIVDGRQRRARFGRYAGEILRAEGLGEVHEIELAGVMAAGLAGLARFGVVVLAGCGAVPGLLELLTAYVEAGGRLLLIRPPAELAPLAGLRPLFRALSQTLPCWWSPVELPAPCGASLTSRCRWPVRSTCTTLSRARPCSPGPWAVAGPWAPIRPSWSAPPAARAGAERRSTTCRRRWPGCARATRTWPVRHGRPCRRPPQRRPAMGRSTPAAGHLPQAEVHQALLARAVEWLCPWPLPRLWYLPGDGAGAARPDRRPLLRQPGRLAGGRGGAGGATRRDDDLLPARGGVARPGDGGRPARAGAQPLHPPLRRALLGPHHGRDSGAAPRRVRGPLRGPARHRAPPPPAVAGLGGTGGARGTPRAGDGSQLHHGPPGAQRVPLRRRAPPAVRRRTAARCSRCGSSRPTSRTTWSWAATRSRYGHRHRPKPAALRRPAGRTPAAAGTPSWR